MRPMQWINLLRLAADPKVTRVPVRVLAALRRAGKRRLPEKVDREVAAGIPGLRTLRYAAHWLDGENLTRHNRRWVLNSFLPPFPSRAYERMFEAMLSGRRLSPVSAFLAVTAECRFNCVHCSAKGRPAAQLPTGFWKSVISQLLELDVGIIGFTGGEPMMRDDLAELVKFAADGGAATILFTSGSELTETKAAELKAAGLWALGLSLDHIDPAEFNRFRGHPDAFNLVTRAAKLAVRHKFYTMTCCVASPELVKERMYEKIHALSAELGVQELRIVEPMPCGRMRGADSGAFLTDAEIELLRDFHRTMNRRGARPKVCAFNRIESPELFGCGGGTQHLYVDSAGEVCPCDFTPLSFGNLRREALSTVWRRMNDALGEPRRDCFIRRHADAINAKVQQTGEYPLSPRHSCELCREVGFGTLPDYFRMVTGQTTTLSK